MEKFLYLFRGGMDHSKSNQELQEQTQKWITWVNELRKSGIYLGGDPLQPTGVQLEGKKKTITDGPFVETKEMVGGYVMILAKDINEAVEISKGCPIFEYDGHLEVRPVQKMDI
ncbi:MAG: hypothetical protein JST75_14630 [Bacteroidetes bacterium]|nr:hypothetical protein [Bacteroidota bacterium]